MRFLKILIISAVISAAILFGCDDKSAPTTQASDKIILLISGLGQEDKPHYGVEKLAKVLKEKFPGCTVVTSGHNDYINPELHPSLVIGHSFGSERTLQYKARLIVVVDPVRYGWKSEVMDFGESYVLKITRNTWFPLPPVANVKSINYTEWVGSGNHNTVMADDNTHAKIVEWVSANGFI